jgi:hypothetical protein
MLRKVTPQSVTVWLALRASGHVALKILTAVGTPVISGSRNTVAIGLNLHIVAVTAQSTSGNVMKEGEVYQYDLDFIFNDAKLGHMTLADATANALLAYKPTYSLPTFCLPPQDPGLLRLICGSCRKASGDGKDHLAILDSLISQAVESASPLVRPHQLLLMGDQIYADDVAEGLLTMLTDASSALLGWEENIPGGLSGQPFKAADRPAYTRYQILKDAGFTSEDMRCHLMSLGEYLCMYLFVWSDLLWPKESGNMPSYDEIVSNVKAAVFGFESDEFKTVLRNLERAETQILDANKALYNLQAALPYVRRALANIPTYMICDDHEVTDDWNMTRDDFCKGVYGHDIGMRIVQNAVVAYALCQHWGNAPEQFDPPSTPGGVLLSLLDNVTTASYDADFSSQGSPTIRTLVSVHTYQEIMHYPSGPACYHDPQSLDFHYTIEGPGHQVIVTDTRTFRTYAHGGSGHSDLLPPAQFQNQILGTPNLRTPANVDRVLIVVLTTNAPPAEFVRAFTRHPWLANKKKRYPDIYESWEMLTVPYDRLLKSLSSKLPPNPRGSEKHYGPVIILSGDVHSSFASRLVYQAISRFEDDRQNPQSATIFFAQLVASSFKKQTDDTLTIHKQGYLFNPVPLLKWTPFHVQEGYVGWNVPVSGTPYRVGYEVIPVAPGGRNDVFVTHDKPTLTFTLELPEHYPGFGLQVQPNYRYRLEYLPQSTKAVATSNINPVRIPTLSGLTAASRAAAITNYKLVMDHFKAYHGDGAGGGEIVGFNNLSEVSFEWGVNDEKYVSQKVRWWYTDGKLLEAIYRIKLDPNDFPDFTPAVTP